jgi:protein SCO1/2
MLSTPALDAHTPEETIAELVDAIKLKPSPHAGELLLQLLAERNAFYEGRSANATVRIRGYILAAFEQTGLPAAALPYVLEELESGRDAYLVAGAAKALRGLSDPSSQVVSFLLKAVENIKNKDDALTFEQYKPRWPVTNYTTALAELFHTLSWLGAHAEAALSDLQAMRGARRTEFSQPIRAAIESAIERIQSDVNADHACCHDVPETPAPEFQSITFHTRRPERLKSGLITDVEMEDQIGNTLTYGEFFTGKPSIVAFFYTRCNNPNKCSLTITKLARLQKAIKEQGLDESLKTAAISYDPEYDLPPRLKAYGESRGVVFTDQSRMLRTRFGFRELQEYFQLGVNFTEATVNRHRIELFILDSKGEIAVTFSRLQWDVQEVLEQAKALLRLTKGVV